MRERVGRFLGVVFLIVFSIPATGAEHRHAAKHLHGAGELNIAVERNAAVIEFRAPGESLYGFEHEAKTDAEKKKQQAAVELLKAKTHEMVILDNTLGCKFTPKKVAVVEQDPNDGKKGQEHKSSPGKQGEHKKSSEHREVIAEFSLTCDKPLSGSNVQFGFTKMFPSLHEVKVQALSGDKQTGATIQKDKGSVKL
jgi:hypothetical protein